jgi:diguanylate cyclase (GGDEF)-like protein/PAS domain S-box-containing protein
MAAAAQRPGGPGFILTPEVEPVEPLVVSAAQVVAVLGGPLDVLAQQTPLLITVDGELVIRFVAGRLSRPSDVGAVVDAALAEHPELVAGLRAAVADGQVRRFDLEVGARVLEVVVRPVLAEGAIRGAIAATTDVTAARASLRRSALLAQMTAEHAAVQDEPAPVMDLVVRAVADYVRSPVVLRTVQGGGLELQAAADHDPVTAQIVRRATVGATALGPGRLRDRLVQADGPVTVPWSSWIEEVPLPQAVRDQMAVRGARAVVAWPMRAAGRFVGLLTVVAVRGDRMHVDTDESEQRFLGDVAARAALHVEAARLRAAAATASAALADSEARFRSAFWAAPVGMVLIGTDPDRPGQVIAVNQAGADLIGRTAAELAGSAVPDLVHPLDADDVADLLDKVASGRLAHGSLEHRVTHPDGSVAWVRTSIALAEQEPGRQRQIVGHLEDVTERRQAQDELARRALYDGLTGLANRHLATDHLRRALAGLSRHAGRVAVLFADLDRFKAINDTFGRDAGDQVLIEVAARLQTTVHQHDVAARIGGDEFLLVCQDVRTDDELRELLDGVLAVLDRPVQVRAAAGLATVHVGASVGVAVTTDPGSRPDVLLHEADTAMYEAKRLGRHRYQVFQESLGQPASRWLRVERDLRAAMAEDRLVLHYQPIVELGTGRIRGVEALLRMRDPVRGLIAPGEFIDVAEESALTYPLGAWVVAEGCRQLARWQRLPRPGPPLTLAVNVTGRQVADAARSGSVLSAAREAGLELETLCLEVTERTLLDAADSVVGDLEAMTTAGVRLAIDDFGTGYSSLTYLQRFPVHALKIDQSFVAGLGVNPRDDAIVAAVVALGATLGLEVVAEGIETPEQLAALQALGCPAGQGFLLGRPMPADEFTALLDQGVAAWT